MKKIKKILIIIQRSNGDVFLSISLINALYEYYQSPKIDLLVNDDTLALAELLPNINFIHQFSYSEKTKHRLKQEKNLILSIYKKYDLSINLTASDRSVIYSILSGKRSISAIEKDNHKSWWKKKILNSYYYFDNSKHILLNNLQPLNILNINYKKLQKPINFDQKDILEIKEKFGNLNDFIIFHPSAQYKYKVYPRKLRDKLLNYLNTLNIPIIITGGGNELDLSIKKEIPSLSNIYNFIGQTSLKEYMILSQISLGYIGMDTLNMHIAAAQNKRIFAIFGPTKLSMWSPWSNVLKKCTSRNISTQTYGLNTIFQSTLPCIVCGKVGCGHNHGLDELPYDIDPKEIFTEIENWYFSLKNDYEY